MLTERGEIVVTGHQEVEARLRKETSQMPVLTHQACQAPGQWAVLFPFPFYSGGAGRIGKAWFLRSPKECLIWTSKALGVRNHSTLSVSCMHFYASDRLSSWEKSTEMKLYRDSSLREEWRAVPFSLTKYGHPENIRNIGFLRWLWNHVRNH